MTKIMLIVCAVMMTWALAGCDCTGQPDSILCPSNAPPASSGTGGDVPCGASVCDDGAGGTLQDTGEHCAGDDDNPAENGGAMCCHGLTCQGATATSMGTCARVAASAGETMCPLVWLYQCDGYYQGGNTAITWTGRFTGPPPSQVSSQPGGVSAWMKTKFWSQYATIVQNGAKYTLIAAKNCQALGPYPGP